MHTLAISICLYLLYPAGADRAAGFGLPGPGIYYGAPHVPFGAAPPDLFMASRRHLLRRQRAVELARPLGGDARLDRREVVEARQDLPPRAVWAAASA